MSWSADATTNARRTSSRTRCRRRAGRPPGRSAWAPLRRLAEPRLWRSRRRASSGRPTASTCARPSRRVDACRRAGTSAGAAARPTSRTPRSSQVASPHVRARTRRERVRRDVIVPCARRCRRASPPGQSAGRAALDCSTKRRRSRSQTGRAARRRPPAPRAPRSLLAPPSASTDLRRAGPSDGAATVRRARGYPERTMSVDTPEELRGLRAAGQVVAADDPRDAPRACARASRTARARRDRRARVRSRRRALGPAARLRLSRHDLHQRQRRGRARHPRPPPAARAATSSSSTSPPSSTASTPTPAAPSSSARHARRRVKLVRASEQALDAALKVVRAGVAAQRDRRDRAAARPRARLLGLRRAHGPRHRPAHPRGARRAQRLRPALSQPLHRRPRHHDRAARRRRRTGACG